MVDIVRYVDADAPGGGDGSIGSPYNSLASWDSNEAGVVNSPDRHICNFRTGTNTDSSRINLSGWSGSGVLIIQRWPGAADAMIKPSGGSGHAIQGPPAMLFEMYQIDLDMVNMSGASEEGLRMHGPTTVRKCRIGNGTRSDQDCIYCDIRTGATYTHRVENCAFYNIYRSFVVMQRGTNQRLEIVNCTGYDADGRGNQNCACFGYDVHSTRDYINCQILIANVVGSVGSNDGRLFLGLPVSGGGSWDPANGNNRSSDDSAETQGWSDSIGNVNFVEGVGAPGDAMFVSLQPTPDLDLHIIDDPGNTLRDTGAGPSHPTLGPYIPTEDYDGDVRAGVTTDIGFDVIASIGPTPEEGTLALTTNQQIVQAVNMIASPDVGLTSTQALDLAAMLVGQAEMNLASSQNLNVGANSTLNADMFLQTIQALVVGVESASSAEILLQAAQSLAFDAVVESLLWLSLDSVNTLEPTASYTVVVNVDLDSQSFLDLDVLGQFYAEMLFNYSSLLFIHRGGDFEGSIALNADQQLFSDSMLAILGDIVLGLVTSLGFSEEHTQGGFVGLNLSTYLDLDVLAHLGVDIQLASNNVLSFAGGAIVEGDLELTFDCAMNLGWSEPGPVEIITPDHRILKITYNDRKLHILVQNRVYPIEGANH